MEGQRDEVPYIVRGGRQGTYSINNHGVAVFALRWALHRLARYGATAVALTKYFVVAELSEVSHALTHTTTVR